MNNSAFRDHVTNAIRFWERGRVLYNAALLLVVAGIFLFHLPHSRQLLSFDLLQGLFLLAVLANVAYCAAYPVDLLAQASGFRETWLRLRWGLLAIGVLFACVITQLFARELFVGAT